MFVLDKMVLHTVEGDAWALRLMAGSCDIEIDCYIVRVSQYAVCKTETLEASGLLF